MGLKGFKVGEAVEVFRFKSGGKKGCEWSAAKIVSRFPMSTWEGKRSYTYSVSFDDGQPSWVPYHSNFVRRPNDPVELRRLATIARLKRKEKKKPRPLRAHDLKGE